jgi:hypothetical protein
MNIGTIILIVVIIILLYWLISSYIVNKNILTSMANATVQQTIAASSLASSSTPGNSNFAYSIWFYISSWNTRYGQPKILLGRMLETTSTPDPETGISGKYPAPVIILGAISNDIDVGLTLYASNYNVVAETSANIQANKYIEHTCRVSNIPIQQWVNFTMSVYGRTLDIYINGKLVRTCVLPGTAAVDTTNNLYVTPLGGFEGSTTKLAYYANALNPEQAWNIYEQGYGSGLSNLFGSYQLNISILQNGEPEASLTI